MYVFSEAADDVLLSQITRGESEPRKLLFGGS